MFLSKFKRYVWSFLGVRWGDFIEKKNIKSIMCSELNYMIYTEKYLPKTSGMTFYNIFECEVLLTTKTIYAVFFVYKEQNEKCTALVCYNVLAGKEETRTTFSSVLPH